MHRAMVERHLREAERHVVHGQMRLARQRAILAELERDGHDTKRAIELLATFEATQRLHIADRDRIEEELRGRAD